MWTGRYIPTDDDLDWIKAYLERMMAERPIFAPAEGPWQKTDVAACGWDEYLLECRPVKEPDAALTLRLDWPNRGPWNEKGWTDEMEYPYPMLSMYPGQMERVPFRVRCYDNGVHNLLRVWFRDADGGRSWRERLNEWKYKGIIRCLRWQQREAACIEE